MLTLRDYLKKSDIILIFPNMDKTIQTFKKIYFITIEIHI